jgi:hypothetical protein
MALFQKAVTQKRRDTDYSETLLLNTKKLVDFHPDSDGQVIFYYADVDNHKVKPIEYHCADGFDTFVTEMREAETEEEDTGYRIITLTAEKKGPNQKDFAKKIGFHKDNFVKAFADPDDSNKSQLFISYGGYQVVQYKVNASLTEIAKEASASVSVV